MLSAAAGRDPLLDGERQANSTVREGKQKI